MKNKNQNKFTYSQPEQVAVDHTGAPIDNTSQYVRDYVKPIKLTTEQQQNWKMYGSLNKPETNKTYISQGRKLTPIEQKLSDKKLKEQENLQNYQKQQEKEAHDLQHAVEVAPYVIPGVGQAMWVGKSIDVATNKLSNDKYKSWGDMVNQTTGSGELVGDLTNPGYYAGAFPKLIGKGLQQTGKLLNNSVQNAYKINPWAFKPNPEAAYRGIGKAGYDDLIQTGEVRSLKRNAYPEPYFAKGIEPGNYAKGYMIELNPNEPMKGVGAFTDYHNDLIGTPVNKITINNPNLKILKKDWLKGYKEIKVPQKQFQSEIDWGKWNSEIPSNKPLMQEYHAIERATKQNGTWMKNPDGSNFNGTPEQFVQQNSENFKKSYPTHNKGYHYSQNKFNAFDESKFDRGLYGKGIYTYDIPTKNSVFGNEEYQLYLTNKNIKNAKTWYDDFVKNIPYDKSSNEYFDAIKYAKMHREYLTDEFDMMNGIDGHIQVSNFKNYPKSAIGNNGMFDMTNPNIYKGLIPAAGLYGLTQSKNKK